MITINATSRHKIFGLIGIIRIAVWFVTNLSLKEIDLQKELSHNRDQDENKSFDRA